MFSRFIIALALIVLSQIAINSAFAQGPGAGDSTIVWSAEIPGLFCHVEMAEVCVIARTEEDCKKIRGVKIDKCFVSDKENEE